MSTPDPTVSVIVVSYGSEDDLAELVPTIADHAELVVVDQSAVGRAGEVVRATRPDAVVLRSGANRGFGSGCNLGAANASGEILVFVNPDVRLGDRALERLARRSCDCGGAMVGPTLLEPDGTAATRARNWSSPLVDVVDLIVPQRAVPRSLKRDIPTDDPRYRHGGVVPYVQGACFAVGRAALVSVGGFDEQFFLYGEEEYLARRLAAQGVPTFLEPSAVATHAGHTSTDRVREFAIEQMFRSRILNHWDQRGAISALAGFSTLWLALAFLLATTPLRMRVSYRETFDVRACRAALRGVRAGLLRQVVRPPQQASAA